MSFRKVKEWDNREERRVRGRLVFTNGRSWTRRVQWLEDSDEGPVKIKFWELDTGGLEAYTECGVPQAFARTVWDRFKEGQSAQDALSIFRVGVKPSRKAQEQQRPELRKEDG